MKAVLFDLDGTIFDSIYDIVSALNVMLDRIGLSPINEKQAEPCLGYGAKRLVIDAINLSANDKEYCSRLGEEKTKELLSFYSEMYKNNCDVKTKLFDGIKDVIYKLKEQGVIVAILTNKPQPTTDKMVKSYFGEGVFDKVVGQSGDKKCKPDKESALKILSEFGVSQDKAIMVGDGETDYLTSVNAGIHHICVTWGYRRKEQLQEAGATNFVNNSKELYNLILKLLG